MQNVFINNVCRQCLFSISHNAYIVSETRKMRQTVTLKTLSSPDRLMLSWYRGKFSKKGAF